MGSEEERRCESMWNGIGMSTQPVRCDRWADHVGEHRGFGREDVAYRWPQQVVEARRLGERLRIEALEKQLGVVIRQRDDALTQIVTLEDERDEAQGWVERLEKQLARSTNEAGEAVGSASERVAELELQVANQADMIRRQREELQRLRAGAEA